MKNFSIKTRLNLSNLYKTGSSKKFSEFLLNYEHSYNKYTIKINESTTFEDLEKELKKTRFFENLQFKSWDDSLVSNKNSVISSTNKDMIFLRFNKEEWKEISRINNNIFEIKKIEISKIPNCNSNEIALEDENKISELKRKILQLENNVKKNYPLDLILNYTGKSNSLLQEELFSLEKEYSVLWQNKIKYENKAKSKAKFVIALGGILFIVELFLLYYGTFIEFSWDVTEPMTYLVTCFNFLLILLFNKKFKGASAHSYFTKKFLAKSFGTKNLVKIQELQQKINFIKNQVKI